MSSDLEPPLLLLATPQVLDPFFRQSVVLLLQHSEEGSLGFIINRTTGIRVAEILDGLEIPWEGDETEAAFFGGPVQPNLGTVLFHRSAEDSIVVDSEAVTELVPGLLMTQHVGTLATLAAEPPGFFRFVLGYSGWGEGQLTEELERNDWLVAPPSDELLFAAEPEAIWAEAMRGLGIEPEDLTPWTPEEDSTVN